MESSFLRTVPGALEYAARRTGAGFTFVADDGTEEEWSFERLLDRATEIGGELQARGMKPGDRVALILPTPREFIPTFLGVSRGGGVPVPLYPPIGLGQLGGYLDHARHIVTASRASFVVTNGQIKTVLGKLHDYAPELRTMITAAEIEGAGSKFQEPKLGLDDVAFLQFTSGSTSAPKGVIVTHENLAENSYAVMREGLNSDEQDRGLSWLPLFHDMGLIGFVIAPISHRVPVSFLSPIMFLKRPASWLEYLSKHRATITYGPNFSYALTTKRVRERDLAGLDLSAVRVAGCGAEPVQAGTLRAFADRFSAIGFREEAFVPSYGMAEHTLAIAFSQGVPTDRVDAEKLWTDGEAVAPSDDESETIEIVGCGKAFDGHRIRIVDTATREPLPERRVGEIQLVGPSVMPGYFENPKKSEETLENGWLNTGDLGYLADKQIFICGRAKDVIIVNGKNYYPQDLEWAAGGVEGVRTGNAIAFAAHREGLGREGVVVVAETRETEGLSEISDRVKKAVYEATGLMVDEVALIEAGALPKTSSGKVQRSKARERFEAGTLRRESDDGAAKIAGRVVQSQLAHLRLRIFGRGKK
ncbi:MAG: fatty acyl-AMP ligase [Myxococcota bacterium]